MRSPGAAEQDRAMPRSAVIATLAFAAVAAVAAGCGASDATVNKAGAPVTGHPRTLVFESPGADTEEAVHFAQRVAARSRGTLRAEIVQGYPNAVPANEARLARDLRSGKVGFGFLPARAWSVAGVRAFAALQAPFVIGDNDVARQVATGPAGTALNTALRHAGVVPLGLSPAPLRRVLSKKALRTPADFRGLRIRVYEAATVADDLRALGAEPVRGLDADRTRAALVSGRLDGVETGPFGAVAFGFWRGARRMTAYALFDAFDTIVASASAWRTLSKEQQSALRRAAEDTVRFSESLAERDDATMKDLCHAGVRVDSVSAAQLRAIAQATEPVRAALRSDPDTAAVMKELEATDGAGPKALPAPGGCSDAGGSANETKDVATIPNGVYVTTTTREDHGAGWVAPADGYTWTTSLRDGKWVRTVVPRFPDMKDDVDGAGTYEVHGDEVTFHYTTPEVDASAPETLRWSYYGGRLTLTLVNVADRGARGIYAAHPWRKVR
jgi:C4-dicarboxylate-binding protein DctP